LPRCDQGEMCWRFIAANTPVVNILMLELWST